MSKQKSTVIEETAITRMDNALPQWHMPENPSWDRARDLHAKAKHGAVAMIQMGIEIEALRVQFLNQGARTDVNKHLFVTANVTKGWQQKVRDELGISDDTAYRIVERAKYVCMINDLASGEEAVIYTDSRGQDRQIAPTPEIRQLALRMMDDVEQGTVNAKRAWAGIVGEGSRVDGQGGSASRAATDHARNLKRAIVSLRTSLKAWRHISGQDRIELEEEWKTVLSLLPETMRP
jgi:hypothetical protein